MSYFLRLEQMTTEQVAFGYSPAHETLLSLHVLWDCKHHPLHIPWVRQARRKMSAAMKEEIEAFAFLYGRPIATFWDLSTEAMFLPFSEELHQFATSPVETYVKEAVQLLLRRKIDVSDLASNPDLRQEVLQQAESKYPRSLKTVAELLVHPEKSRARFVAFLVAYWETTLEAEWPRLEDMFMRDIALRGQKLMRQGPLGILDRLSPEVVTDPEKKTAVIRRPSQAEIHWEADDLLFLVPSYFVWPHLFVNLEKPVTLNYSVMELQEDARPPVPPENLLKLFRAMGDLTRLQIVQLLAGRSRSTRELAGLIGISEAAISKHLKLLQEAGILTSKRESYYVLYQLTNQPFATLQHSLESLLRPESDV